MDVLSDLPDLDRQAHYTLEQIQQRVSPSIFIVGSADFAAKRAAMESWFAASDVDEEGRANALRHIAAFYKALAAVTRECWCLGLVSIRGKS
jgi:hypothetical protein